MRYCINCGSPMGDERFCNQCGTDNGVTEKRTSDNTTNSDASDVNLPSADLSLIIHTASVAMFIVTVLILLVTCCKQAGSITAQSVLYTGGVLFSIPYFVIGMWGCLPSLLFLLNIKEKKSTSVAGAAIIMIVIIVAVCLLNVIFIKFNGCMKFFGIMAEPYKNKAAAIIVFGIISLVLGIIEPRITK